MKKVDLCRIAVAGLLLVVLNVSAASAAGTVPVVRSVGELADQVTVISSNTYLPRGTWLQSLGDINGDGFDEVAVSALFSGKVYVIYGGSLQKGRISVQELLRSGRCFVVEDCPYEPEGEGTYEVLSWIAKAGDINSDGLADLVIAGDRDKDNAGSMQSSLAFVLGKREFPTVQSHDDLPKLYGKLSGVYCRFKNPTAAGDVDGDGFDDLLFRSWVWPEDPDYGYPLFFGRADFAPATTYEEELASGGVCRIHAHHATWTATIGPIGDQNGDGRDDLAIAAIPFSPVVDPLRGKLHILYGRARNELDQLRNVANNAHFDLTFPYSEGYNGDINFITGGRDFNCDGEPDILLCDEHRLYAPPPSRAIAIFGGDLEQKVASIGDLTDCLELVTYAIEIGEEGHTIPGQFNFAGDVNGDGYEDLIVHSSWGAYIYYNPMGSVVFGNPFIRGDANQDKGIDIGDAIAILQYLFLGGATLPCMDAADVNDDESVDIADPISLLMWLFANGPPPPPPIVCGPDPAGHFLDCRTSVCL